jgi:two-component system, NarL family, sensor histidine kinase UhpB
MRQHCYKTLFVFVLSAAFFISTQAQNQNKIDSLLNALKTAKEDTSKANILNTLGWALFRINPDTVIILGNQALSLSEKAKSKKHIADSYHIIAEADLMKGNYPASLENNFKALSLREELTDKPGIAASRNSIGNVYSQQGDYPKALDYYFKALKMDEELGNKYGIANGLSNIGLVYWHQGDYPKALDYDFKALKIHEELGNKYGIAIVLGSIGNVYSDQHDYPKTLDYYFKSLKMKEELGNKNGIALTLGNIGIVYQEQGDNLKALDYYFKALKMSEQFGNKYLIAINLGNIGLIYKEQGDYPKALDYLFKALKMTEEFGDKNGIAFSLGNIGIVYTKTGKFAEAEEYLKKAIAINDSIGAMDELRKGEESLSQLYDTTSRYKLALEHYMKAMVLKDTLYNQEKNKEITRKEMNYEFEKTQAADKAGHEKQLAVADVEIKKQTLLKNSFIGGLALVLVLFFFIYKNYRTKEKLKLETIRNNIAADLHDDIGSTLNSISLFSEVAKQEAGKPIPALDQIGVSARKIIDAMGDIVWTINPENDTFENVIARMRSLAYLTLKAKGIEFAFKADESLNQLSLPMLARKNIYLLFKEATNNIVKYSNASRASFHLSLDSKNVKMAIRDNGVGFDMENAQMGNGIKNMKRRATEIGGQLVIESAEGKGTNIELSFKT